MITLSPRGSRTPGRSGRFVAAALAAGSLLALSACSGSSSASSSATPSSDAASGAPGPYGSIYEQTGTGPMVTPTIPSTPSVPTYFGQLKCSGTIPSVVQTPAPQNCTRVFTLTAMEFVQEIATFPMKRATVWGYLGEGQQQPSTPGPTLISYADEKVEVRLVNKLKVPSTIHVHGLHQPNESDGVAGVTQVDPVAPGASFDYPAFVPGHVGTFAYHAHTMSAVEEMRGLNGMWDVLPRQEHASVKTDVDVNMTLQIWGWPKEEALVEPFGVGVAKKFPFDTINGKTGDAAGAPINIKKGDLVRIRVYNASQETHSMHLHGHDLIAVSKSGHAISPIRETTQTINPGDFYEMQFTANNPGNWIFHCHFPHHTSNGMKDGFHGAPVGMTRIFHYEGADPVSPGYFGPPKA